MAAPASASAGLVGHPVEVMVAAVEVAVGSVDRAAWEGLDAASVRGLYGRLARVGEQLGAHKLAAARVLDAAGAAKAAGAASTGSMLGADFGGDRRAGDELVRLGSKLVEAGATATEDAFAAGRITQAQTGVIAAILNNLPGEVSEADREVAEGVLLTEAPSLSLRDLRARGDRISEVFRSPAQADADEEALVSSREREAYAATEFWMRDTGRGTYRGGFTLPALQGEMLKTLLDAVASPRRAHLRAQATPYDTTPDTPGSAPGSAPGTPGSAPGTPGTPGSSPGTSGMLGTFGGAPASNHAHAHAHAHGDGRGGGGGTGGGLVPDRRSYQQKLGQAFCALIEHTPTDGYAHSGGSAAVVAVSLSYEKLVSSTGCGTATTGTRVSAGQARRLACSQQVLPQVFNGGSLPLDHGSKKRLFSRTQRFVYAQRDMGCVMPGCDRPASWCECHHAGEPWAQGGPTDLDQGVLLCAFHHHIVHDQGWAIRFHPDDGIPELQRPGTTTWQRNTRYRPPRDLGTLDVPARAP